MELQADNAARIKALVVSASLSVGVGGAGVGASIGVALARNLIGWDPQSATTSDFTTADQPTQIVSGQRVKIAAGPRAGDVYEYVGATPLAAPVLIQQDYANGELWQQVNLGPARPRCRHTCSTRASTPWAT